MSPGTLYLHPTDPARAPQDTDDLIATLRQMGLVAAAQGATAGHGFHPGVKFLQLVTFLGCSPYVNMDEGESGGGGNCRVYVIPPAGKARFLFGRNTLPPRCPHCGQKDPAWKSMTQCWLDDPTPSAWRCRSCGVATSPTGWDWRRSAGFGRQFIAITGIFPGEAVPSEALLEGLLKSSGQPWDYFYCQPEDDA